MKIIHVTLVSLALVALALAGCGDSTQGGLEKRLGAAPAMAVTSLPVWFAHLDHADGAARWALLLGMSAMRGALT